MWWKRCKHPSKELTTTIGRNPSPYILTVTRCKNCGERVPPQWPSPLSDDDTYRLLKRAEDLPEGATEIVITS